MTVRLPQGQMLCSHLSIPVHLLLFPCGHRTGNSPASVTGEQTQEGLLKATNQTSCLNLVGLPSLCGYEQQGSSLQVGLEGRKPEIKDQQVGG